MRDSTQNILIVDDDETFGKSIQRILSKKGFNARNVSSPEKALDCLTIQEAHGLVIDCMLPKMSGVELAEKIMAQSTYPPIVFLMSGIFVDKQFIKDALHKTKAVSFLTKPFKLEDFVNQFEKHFPSRSNEDKNLSDHISQFYISKNPKPEEVIQFLNNTSTHLNAFDLLWVFKLALESKLTGYLDISNSDKEQIRVSFQEGHVIGCQADSQESMMGILLVELGYLDHKDLGECLMMDDSDKKIGEALVEMNMISPHAINLALKEQIIWRFREFIKNSQVEIKYTKADSRPSDIVINEKDLNNFFVDMIESMDSKWLQTHYLNMGSYQFKIENYMCPHFKKILEKSFAGQEYAGLEKNLKEGMTINDILDKNMNLDGILLKTLHLLNIFRQLYFQEQSTMIDFSRKIKHLKKLYENLHKKNMFERLGLSATAKEDDIKTSYINMAKILHPDRLDPHSPTELIEITKKVFEKVQESYDNLKQADRREAYLKEMKNQKSQEHFQAEEHKENGKNLLLKGQYAAAAKELNKALEKNPQSSEIQILSVWSQIKNTKSFSKNFFEEMLKKLNKIPPAFRNSPIYYHTRGLYYTMTQNKIKAEKYFQIALGMNHTFIDSRRELSLLRQNKSNENKSSLSNHFKDVVGLVFNKKS